MFTLKKFISNKKNKVLLILTICSIIFLFIGFETVELHSSKELSPKTTIQTSLQSGEHSIRELKSLIKDGIDTERNKKILANLEKIQELEQKSLEAIDKKDYKEYHRLGNVINGYLDDMSESSDQDNGAMNDDYSTSMSNWYKLVVKSGQDFPETTGTSESGLGGVHYILAGIGGIFGLVLISLLCGDALANENPNGLRFYKLMKSRKSSLQLKYLLVPTGVSFGLVLLLLFIFGGIASLQYGLGSFSYPDFVVGGSFQYYQGSLILWRIFYLLLVILFITSLGQLLGQIVKKAYLSSLIIVVVLVAYNSLQTQEFMKEIIRWIPLTYLNVNTVIYLSDGRKEWPFSGDFLFGQNSLWIGATVLIICSIIFYLLTHLIFARYIYRKK